MPRPTREVIVAKLNFLLPAIRYLVR